jgi:hypothetical protein
MRALVLDPAVLAVDPHLAAVPLTELDAALSRRVLAP